VYKFARQKRLLQLDAMPHKISTKHFIPSNKSYKTQNTFTARYKPTAINVNGLNAALMLQLERNFYARQTWFKTFVSDCYSGDSKQPLPQIHDTSSGVVVAVSTTDGQ